MSEDSTTQCLLFPVIFRKPVVAQFDQREGSSDGGALLLKSADQPTSRQSNAPGLREAWNAGDFSRFHGWNKQASAGTPCQGS
jgi:hypothetical protein